MKSTSRQSLTKHKKGEYNIMEFNRTPKADEPSTGDNNYLIYCPSSLGLDHQLSDGARSTYLLISNFLNRDGYAFCSNKWLVEHRKRDERIIRYHLEELEQRGYIYREVYKKGFITKRRIWVAGAYAKYLLENGKTDPDFEKVLRNAKSKEDSENSGSSGEDSNNVHDRLKTAPSSQMKSAPSSKLKTAPIISKYNNKEETTAKNRGKKDGDESPTSLFSPNEKSNSKPDDQDHLPLFHSSRKYLRGLSQSEITQAKFYYEKTKNTVANPEGWITDCVKGGWYKQEMICDADLISNFKLARKIEENFTKLGLQGIDTSCYSDSNRISFRKGGKDIPSPSFSMQQDKFKELTVNILRENYECSDKLLI